jgi:glycosyltransferase involved in cell wall biosynthesis
MKPIRLAVFFDQPILAGGGYQQALNSILLARKLPSDLVDNVFLTTISENVQVLATYGIKAELFKLTFFQRVRMHLRERLRHKTFLSLIKRVEKYSVFEKKLIKLKIDLVYFLSPNGWARCLEELNYITTIWDFCHRDDLEFPEVRWERELETRDEEYQAILQRAVGVFVDSEHSKRNALRRYGIDEIRIHIIPFQASHMARRSARKSVDGDLNICEKYNLDMPYVFYPGQFWAHKNHVYVLEGLRSLECRYNLKIGAIFCGAEKGNLRYIQDYVHKLGLASRIRFAGFVSDREVIELYRQSFALVMPTYFGATNLPPLEAFELGVPVLYSDKAGLRDQVGDAALLLDLQDPTTMADQLSLLKSDQKLREDLIQKGFDRIKHFDSVDRGQVLRSVIENFRWRRLCWK